MSKNIVVINAGPRKGWNTDTLIKKASEGAQSVGATIKRYDLFQLERYTGCISCFECKRVKNKGLCQCHDALWPVLNAIKNADGLIIGSPNYFSDFTASFRALYERLMFPRMTYNNEDPICNPHPIPVLLIMTCNAEASEYDNFVSIYQQVMNRMVGETKVLISADTMILKDFSKTEWEWNFFDLERKKHIQETIFPKDCKKAFELGAELAK